MDFGHLRENPSENDMTVKYFLFNNSQDSTAKLKIASISQFVCVFIYTVVSLRQAGKYILYTLNTLCMII